MVSELEELERDEGLAQLMPDIQLTANLVAEVTNKLEDADQEMSQEMAVERLLPPSLEERYLSYMKKLQFGKRHIDNFIQQWKWELGNMLRVRISHANQVHGIGVTTILG